MARLTHAGKEGPPGPEGPPGEPAETYEFKQESPSSIWHIIHHLKRKPSVTVEDTAEDQVEGTVEYINSDELTLKFSASIAGKAYLN